MGSPNSPNAFRYHQGQKSRVPLAVTSFINSSRKLQPPFSARTKEVQQERPVHSINTQTKSYYNRQTPISTLTIPFSPQINMPSKLYKNQIISKIWTTFTEAGFDQEARVCASYHAGKLLRNTRATARYWGFPFHQQLLWINCSSSVWFLLLLGISTKLTQ